MALFRPVLLQNILHLNFPSLLIFQISAVSAVITPSSGKNVAKWSPILVFLARSEGAEGEEEELKEDGNNLIKS